MRLIKAAAAALVVTTLAAPSIVAAQQTTPPVTAAATQGTLLTISADGKTEARPDMGIVSLGVMTEGATAAEALSANASRMTALNQALRRAGIAERDIQTSNISVNPQYQYVEGQQPRVTGYQANNQVTVRVRDLNRLGRTIDGAVAAGGNTVNGVSFTFQDPDAQVDAARTDAIAEARRRGDLYAQALGMRIHRVVAVSESGGFSPPVPMPYMMERAAAMDASTPVSPGEVETRMNLTFVFELR